LTAPLTVEVLTAPDAEAAQRRAAGALELAGLRGGDRVAICLPSSAALLCAVLGGLRTGVVPVLLNATLTDSERDVLIEDAEPDLVITDSRQLAALDEGPPIDLAPFPLTRPMHYTSGTT
jgi:long-chain acyl-CoA synthetase